MATSGNSRWSWWARNKPRGSLEWAQFVLALPIVPFCLAAQFVQWRRWQRSAPRTLDAAVTEFLAHHLSPEGHLYLASLSRDALNSNEYDARLPRRVAFTFGLAEVGPPAPGDDPYLPGFAPGWNEELARSCGTDSPEAAARLIVVKMWERLTAPRAA